MIPATKTCTKCGETKPLEGFPPRRNQCQECVREYHRAYQRSRHEELKAYWRGYYYKPEVQERVKARRAAEPKKGRSKYSPSEKALAVQRNKRRYYEKNKEAVKTRARAREREATVEERRSRRYRLDPLAREYAAILTGDPCSYCGGPMRHLDHIVARSHGGDNDWTNLTAACDSCNTSKQQRPMLLYLWYRTHSAA
jgi:5-methylcytosine-specific restriction endonuclease McrA